MCKILSSTRPQSLHLFVGACEVACVAVVLDAEVGDVKGDRGLGLQHELVVRLWDVRLRGVCGVVAAQLLIVCDGWFGGRAIEADARKSFSHNWRWLIVCAVVTEALSSIRSRPVPSRSGGCVFALCVCRCVCVDVHERVAWT